MSRTWGPDETDVIAAELTACVLGQRGGNGPMIRRRGRLYHRDCWEKEKGE
jgi:hypothetical protein